MHYWLAEKIQHSLASSRTHGEVCTGVALSTENVLQNGFADMDHPAPPCPVMFWLILCDRASACHQNVTVDRSLATSFLPAGRLCPGAAHGYGRTTWPSSNDVVMSELTWLAAFTLSGPMSSDTRSVRVASRGAPHFCQTQSGWKCCRPPVLIGRAAQHEAASFWFRRSG